MVRLKQRLKEFWNRPAGYGSVVLSYIGIFIVAATLGGAAIYSDRASTRELCQVVANVHDQAVRDYDREYAALIREVDAYKQTLDYLKETDPGESPSLYRRIKQNLPNTLARVDSAQEAVESQREAIAATALPTVCHAIKQNNR